MAEATRWKRALNAFAITFPGAPPNIDTVWSSADRRPGRTLCRTHDLHQAIWRRRSLNCPARHSARGLVRSSRKRPFSESEALFRLWLRETPASIAVKGSRVGSSPMPYLTNQPGVPTLEGIGPRSGGVGRCYPLVGPAQGSAGTLWRRLCRPDPERCQPGSRRRPGRAESVRPPRPRCRPEVVAMLRPEIATAGRASPLVFSFRLRQLADAVTLPSRMLCLPPRLTSRATYQPLPRGAPRRRSPTGIHQERPVVLPHLHAGVAQPPHG
jgi:hypothetical protein